MFLYGYKCKSGHEFEAFAPLSEFDMCKPCPQCGKPAERFLTPVAMHGFDTPLARQQRDTYHTHNKTFHGSNEEGTVSFAPLSPSEQCQCGDCSQHRSRAPITGTADVRKDVVV